MRSDPHGEALRGKHVSRSESEPVSASLSKAKAANPPEGVKPDTDGEVTSVGTRPAFRGGCGQRAWTDRPRNLGGLAGRWQQQRRGGRHNPTIGPGQESDRPVVAGKRLITVEPRGLTVDVSL